MLGILSQAWFFSEPFSTNQDFPGILRKVFLVSTHMKWYWYRDHSKLKEPQFVPTARMVDPASLWLDTNFPAHWINQLAAILKFGP